MTDERLRIERLAGLCRVWGAAKFSDPYLAYKDIDWDAALVSDPNGERRVLDR